VYILLLPLGGYRVYRPYSIRYDTILPVTLALFFYYGYSTFFILKNIAGKKTFYILAVIVFSIVFTLNDEPGFERNACEKQAILELQNSQDEIVQLTSGCSPLSWGKVSDFTDTYVKGELLHIWRITPERKLYFQE
jgi:hypothetical protein